MASERTLIEAVGAQEWMMQAIRATRRGGRVGYVGVAHDGFPGLEMFFSHVHLHGGPARRPRLPSRTDRPHPARRDQPGQSL